jgi:hypothetical protein
MGRVRSRLTYANVMATVAVFIALGGASYAAIKLPRNSVGARQLKKGAVTPAKLGKATRKALVGPRGATGPQGLPGPKGDTGTTGPQGPGAISLERKVPAELTFFKTVAGIEIGTECKLNDLRIELQTVGKTRTLKVGGTYTAFAEPADVTAPANGLNAGYVVYAVALEKEVITDIVARNTAFGPDWGAFDFTLDEECNFRGMYIPSTPG